ncbi:Non-hem dioxygenase N-terminal domain [Dillenia turbinata]|uniref:Non-hem dioxygenase N-terminal domain n=1 Tax=Dillenia turbinata TaxID=194707 RepID=A0AAN8VE57_9MAGN
MGCMTPRKIRTKYRELLKLHSAVQNEHQYGALMEECELPLIDLSCLISAGCKDGNNEKESVACIEAIFQASSEWGFFQVVNHGISPKLLKGMRAEQINLFETSLEKKSTSTNPNQFSWSEAFHVPVTKISEDTCYGEFTSLRDVMQEIAGAMSRSASLLANVLAERLCSQRRPFEEICDESTCFLRLNHYLPLSSVSGDAWISAPYGQRFPDNPVPRSCRWTSAHEGLQMGGCQTYARRSYC